MLVCSDSRFFHLVSDFQMYIQSIVFNTLRVWAIWGQRRLYVLVMLPLTLVLPCVNIVSPTYSPSPMKDDIRYLVLVRKSLCCEYIVESYPLRRLHLRYHP